MSKELPQTVDLHRAMRMANERLRLAQAQPDAFSMCHALTQVARCYKLMGLLAETQLCLQQALGWCRLMGSNDAVVDLLCELSETAATLAETDDRPRHAHASKLRACCYALQASAAAAHVSDPQAEAQMLLRISDVLARCGDRDDAALLQTRALRLLADPAQTEPAANPHLMPGLGRLADT